VACDARYLVSLNKTNRNETTVHEALGRETIQDKIRRHREKVMRVRDEEQVQTAQNRVMSTLWAVLT